MCSWYLGPLIVIFHNRGAYVLCELDRSVLHQPVAAFWLISYLAYEKIFLPLAALDINTARLCKLEETELVNDDEIALDSKKDQWSRINGHMMKSTRI